MSATVIGICPKAHPTAIASISPTYADQTPKILRGVDIISNSTTSS
jgi:hypothetical protein